MSGITGSASGGMGIALDTFGKYYLDWANRIGMNPELLHRLAGMASGGMDSLPHNGAVITLLSIAGLTHKQSYRDIFAIIEKHRLMIEGFSHEELAKGKFMDKVTSLDQALENIHDGATIMLGGFAGMGSPLKTIDKLVEIGVKDLTIIAVVNAYPGQDFDIALLFKSHLVKKLITSHSGTCQIALDQYANGEIEIEYFPMGTFIEKIRAGGAGLGGVLTATGLGTLVEEGKEKLTVQGKEYLLELPLRADYAFIKGYRGDKYGNIQYRGVALNSNPIMATAGDCTVAEVNEIVDVGSIHPESVGTPSVFVQAVVQGHPFENHKKIYTDLWLRSKQIK